MKITEIKFNPTNPRIIKDSKFKELVQSIKDFPDMLDLRPIVIDENNMILGGNMRLKACIEAGLAEVPVTKAHLSEEQKKEFIIKDNVGYGEWDWDTLANGWDVAKLEEWGLDVCQNIYDIESGLIDDDEIPETKESKVKTGDIWQLGNHRLMCGDSTNIDDVKKLMNGNKSDLVFTDPPYDIINQDYCSLINKYTENSHVFVMHDDRGIVEYLRESTLEFLRFFVADFTFSSPRGNDPYLRHILISHESKGNTIKHQNMYDGFSSIIKMKYRGTITNEDIFHKHQKPIDFVEKFINHFSIKDSIILDLFLGSGATLISSEKNERICYGMELDENYCDSIITRWEQYTGKKSIKL
jgi:DNA modification methylase